MMSGFVMMAPALLYAVDEPRYAAIYTRHALFDARDAAMPAARLERRHLCCDDA